MWENINKEYLKTHKFEKLQHEYTKKEYKPAFFAKGEVDLPTIDENYNTLRDKIQDLCYSVKDALSKAEGKRVTKRELLEVRCRLNFEIVKKFISWNGTDSNHRNLSRIDLGKFCVGCKLTLEQAEELFALHKNGKLNPEVVKEDCIIVDALKCGDSIQLFCESCDNNGIELKDEREEKDE